MMGGDEALNAHDLSANASASKGRKRAVPVSVELELKQTMRRGLKPLQQPL
jgi:hypothetical protein